MKLSRAFLSAVIVAGAATLGAAALASPDLVKFPQDFDKGVLYATVERGNLKEEIFTGREAIDAVKRGEALPSGTVITLVDYRDGKLHRYVVMEKRSGWGAQYPDSKRNGEWEFQAFNADKTVNTGENLDRCFGCHKPQAATDFVWTLNRMKTAQ